MTECSCFRCTKELCERALSDIAVHPKGDYPQKIKAAGCCGPVVECDRNGKPLPASAEAA